MPFFLNLYFQAPKHPLAHVSMQIRTKPRTPNLMALPFYSGGTGFGTIFAAFRSGHGDNLIPFKLQTVLILLVVPCSYQYTYHLSASLLSYIPFPSLHIPRLFGQQA